MKQVVSFAKLTRPKSANVLLRKRLFKLLDEARNKPVVWITAPPGAGKTTLVSTYLENKNLPCIWYQIDEGDGDIASFFHYMGIAAKHAAPRYRKPLPNLTPEYFLGLPTFTRNYFRELYSRVNLVASKESLRGAKRQSNLTKGIATLPSGARNDRFIVVLDNYQDVPADSHLHNIIQTGLSEIPEGINVIIISRVEPPAIFAGLRANNKIDAFGWNELNLTIDEAKDIAKLKGIKRPSEELIQQLNTTVNGWTAGIVLMLERQKPEKLLQKSSGIFASQAMFDYFASEIFNRLDEPSREMLLKTAFLPIMTERLVQQLTDSVHAGQILADLNRRNYFIIKKPLPEPVYQYHPLFREFLLTLARQQLTPLELAQVQHKTAEILEGYGQFEDAIVLYRNAEEWASMARLILTQAQAMIVEGRNKTLEEWISHVPQAILNDSPWMLYWLGVCLLPFNPPQARADLEQAYAAFQRQSDVQGQMLAWCAIVDTFVNEWSDFTPLDRWIAEMESLLALHSEFSSPEIGARVAAGMFMALMYRQPGYLDLPKWAQQVRQIVMGDINAYFRIYLGNQLLIYYTWWIGDLALAETLLKALEPLARVHGNPPLVKAAWCSMSAAFFWMNAENEKAIKSAVEGLRIADESGVHVVDAFTCGQAIFATLSSEDMAGAKHYLDEMAKRMNPSRILECTIYHHLLGWYFLMQNDLAKAREQAELSKDLGLKAGSPFFTAHAWLEVGLILFLGGRHEEAIGLNRRTREESRKMNFNTMEYLTWLDEAEFCMGLKDEACCIEALRQSLAVGCRQGYQNHTWWRPTIMARLYSKALEHNIEVDYVQSLIRRRRLSPPINEIDLDNWPWPVRIYTLGRFTIVKDGKPLRFAEKAKHMPLKLLKAIIALGGRDIGAEAVIDTLWPDADGDTGLRSLNTTLHRLRKLLGNDMAITLEDNRLAVDVRHVWVDIFAFQRLLGKIENMLKKAEAKDDSLNNLIERTTAMYQGPFLRDIAEQWAISSRERLKNRYLHILAEMAQRFEQSKDWQKAIQCCEKCIEIDSISEENYRRLMGFYNKLGRKAEGIAVYKRCKEALNRHLGISPSQETEAIHKSLRS